MWHGVWLIGKRKRRRDGKVMEENKGTDWVYLYGRATGTMEEDEGRRRRDEKVAADSGT